MSDATLRYPSKIAQEVGFGPVELAELKWFGCPFWGRKTSLVWVRGFLATKTPARKAGQAVAYWKEELRKRRRALQRVRTSYRTKIPIGMRTFIFARDSRQCRYCGALATQIDHIIAVIKGGGHDADNLAASCKSCNSRKRDKSLEVFLAK